MKTYNTFDIIGPIMIGPSSSHTAGAARIAKLSRDIAGSGFNKVIFYLHGSFKSTYKGHGTDKALVGGVLGMRPDDENIRDSLKIAAEKGIQIVFDEINLEKAHPNTVKTVFIYPDGHEYFTIGSSIGGGAVIIENINGVDLNYTGRYPTILIKYSDRTGVIAECCSVLAKHKHNIANIKSSRVDGKVTLIIEMDVNVSEEALAELEKVKDVNSVKYVRAGGY